MEEKASYWSIKKSLTSSLRKDSRESVSNLIWIIFSKINYLIKELICGPRIFKNIRFYLSRRTSLRWIRTYIKLLLFLWKVYWLLYVYGAERGYIKSLRSQHHSIWNYLLNVNAQWQRRLIHDSLLIYEIPSSFAYNSSDRDMYVN